MRGKNVWGGYAVLFVVILTLAAMIIISSQGRTQQRQPAFDEELMRMMHPVELARQFVTDDELPREIAEFKWELYTEYQKKGFTQDQAFQLVLSGGVPFSASQ